MEEEVKQQNAFQYVLSFPRRMYDWTISWADKPRGMWALGIIAFAESSFFPIPPDVLLIPLVFGAPKKWWKIALVCTIGSVLGAVLGWFIGYFAWDAAKQFFFDYVPGFTAAGVDAVKAKYDEWGVLAVLVAAFSPIPYKLFTIVSGALDYSLFNLVWASVIGRGARFFLVAIIICILGENAKAWIEKYFNILVIIFTILLIGGFVSVKYLI